MANTFKKVIDRMMWVQTVPAPNAHAAASSMAADMRNNTTRNPFIYQLVSNAVLNRYNIVTKAWQLAAANPLTAGTFGAGSTSAFAPSFGAVGTIAAGATTTSVTLSTALPTAVGVNMLANRGGSGELGFRLRIIDTTAGKTEERWIVGNSAGTAPAITVDAAFSFTPATGARYEILCGRLCACARTLWLRGQLQPDHEHLFPRLSWTRFQPHCRHSCSPACRLLPSERRTARQ